MDPERYRHQTYDVTMAAAKTLARLNPGMVFTYVTGKGTDPTEQGPLRWARVKGKTENDLLKLPFRAAYMFRPSGIQPLHGVRSKTAWINAVYAVTAPLLSWMVRAMPGQAGWVNSGAKFGYCWTFRQNQCGGGPAAWSRQAGSCVCVGGGRRGMAAR